MLMIVDGIQQALLTSKFKNIRKKKERISGFNHLRPIDKSCEGLHVLSCLKGNMLDCLRAMDAGRRHEITGLEMKDSIIPTAVEDHLQ